MSSDLFADIFSLCDTVKAWFRELPGGLIPADMYGQAVQATREQCFQQFFSVPPDNPFRTSGLRKSP